MASARFAKYAICIYKCPVKSDELTIRNDYYTYARKIETASPNQVIIPVLGLLALCKEFILIEKRETAGVRRR